MLATLVAEHVGELADQVTGGGERGQPTVMLASAVRSSSAAWTGFSETTRVLTCYGPDSVRQAELSYLTESGHADRKPGGVSLNLVCDL